nr:sulfonate ABC transporter substrate-binding protein [Nocardioides sp.]
MTTSTLRRLALGAAALPIALAGLAACGSDDKATDTSSTASGAE